MSDVLAGVGLRYGVVFELNANGRPKAAGTTAYEGYEFSGPKAYSINIPETRKIAHAGKDRVLVNDQLPSLEAVSGEIRTSSLDYVIDALLMNVKKFTVSGATMVARNNDQQGSEPVVALLLYQQSKDFATGLRNWHFNIIPATQCIPIAASFGENPEDHRYSIAPTPTTKHLWGISLTTLTEGTLEAGVFDGYMAYKPKLTAFLSDGVLTTYVLPSTAANNTYSVWIDGVERTTNITKTTIDFTLSVSIPPLGAEIVVLYGEA